MLTGFSQMYYQYGSNDLCPQVQQRSMVSVWEEGVCNGKTDQQLSRILSPSQAKARAALVALSVISHH